MVDEFKLWRKTRLLLSDASGWAALSTSPQLNPSGLTCQLRDRLSGLALWKRHLGSGSSLPPPPAFSLP